MSLDVGMRRGFRMTLGVKLFAGLAGMVPLIAAVAFVGNGALHSLHADTNRLFEVNVREAVAASELSLAIAKVEATSLEGLSATGERSERLGATLRYRLIPAVDAEFDSFVRLHHNDSLAERQALAEPLARWRAFDRYSESQLSSAGLTARAKSTRARQTSALLDPLIGWVSRRAASEQREAVLTNAAAGRTFTRGRRLIVLMTTLVLVLGAIGALALIRNILPRVRAYSRFAGRVAAGDLSGRISPRGTDELATLGRVLNGMVDARAREESVSAAQAEFIETLQYSETDQDAHALIKRHLERALAGAETVVLRNNNSANRLEPTTPLVEGSPLRSGLEGAVPKSCLAIRLSRPHDERSGGDPLLQCEVCGCVSGATTCRPLLVGSEVIGAVLVESANPLVEAEARILMTTVTEAAPVLANLRTLAVAELRAATDSLTGLPNDRSLRATVKRMVAQASRGVSPLAAIALDLDHFKQINDTYGHGRGDEVLAAVGTTLASAVRDSDFAGRFGGEEFLILLPDTAREGALRLAEKLRAAIERIQVSGIDRPISASLGVAVLPDHAATADSLLREADRALYTAKREGRNRVEIADALAPAVAV